MASLKPIFQALRTRCAFHNQTRLFSSPTLLLAQAKKTGPKKTGPYRRNPLFLRNRFKLNREFVYEYPPGNKEVRQTQQARRKPYRRPKIQPWRTFQEIPYHYREGRNKELLIPEIKKKHIKKYKNQYEERAFYRSSYQRFTNMGKSLLPYDKKIPVITGKHTGPGVEGGSELAQTLAALHLVHPTGFINKRGNFKQVKDMIPDFVVPNLADCKLKPYVSYRAPQINQSKFTARSLYNNFYGEDAKKKFEEETGIKTNLEIVKTVKPEPEKNSYRAPQINQSKFTARSLYNKFYREDAKKKFEEETGIKTNLEIVKTVKPEPEKKSSSWLPWKKEKS